MRRRTLLLLTFGLFLAPAAVMLPAQRGATAPSGPLPARLTGQEFFKLIAQSSEPDGFFRSDNLVSNELYMQRVVPDLARTVKPGRVYLGVGPEQNFTYIAATKPAMAFIIDVRRGNMQLHLMYKALFELSVDRADFVSRLFSLTRPTGLGRKSTVQEIFKAYADPRLRSADLYKKNGAAMKGFFLRKNSPGLAGDDLKGIEALRETFFTRGLDVHYEITPGSAGSFPTYAELMVATDAAGVTRSFLATEETFAAIKDLHSRNLIVPVVGNFAGPKAIRAVGKYIRAHGSTVGAFYVSNVEQYLDREGGREEFCASAATLPLDGASTFIRSERGFGPRGGAMPPRGGFGGNFNSQLHNMLADLKGCTK
jgi:hypothetical protein